MKKRAALIILLLKLCYGGYSQDEITYMERYKDSTRYNIVIDKSWHSETTYYGPDEFLLKLKSQGKDNPAYADKQFTTRMVLRTGLFTDDGNYPLTLEFVNIADNDRELGIPNGALVYGHGSYNSSPLFDSISLSVTGETAKGVETTRQIFSEFALPTKKLKQGQAFSVQSNLHLRLNDAILDLVTTTNYVFNSVANGIANFDITEVCSAKPGEGKYNFKVEGKGSGEMLYDIINQVNLEYQKNTEVSITEDLYNGCSCNYKSTEHYKRTMEMDNK